MKINEEQFENHLLGILGELGYVYENGYEIAPDALRAERTDYREHPFFYYCKHNDNVLTSFHHQSNLEECQPIG